MERRGDEREKPKAAGPEVVEPAASEPDLLAADLDDRMFEVLFLEGILPELPEWTELLTVLAEGYTAVGQYEKGLELDRRLARLKPRSPVVHYNLACSLSLVGAADESLEALVRAIHLGYNDFDHMRVDPDLENVRRDPRFEMILKDAPE